MLRDMGFRENVRAFRLAQELSLNALGKAAGVTATQVKEIEDGKNANPSLDTITALAKALSVPVAELIGEDGGTDHDAPRPEHVVRVPIEAVVVGGDPTEAAEDTGEYFDLLHHLYRPGRKVIRIYGESMYPNLHDRDLVLVDSKERVRDGNIAVVRIGADSTVKRVYRKKNGTGLILKGDNTMFPPIEVDGEDVEIRYKVLRVVDRELR